MLDFEETNCPEIKALQEIYLKHRVEIIVSKTAFLGDNKDYPSVIFTLSGKSFDLFVDDEYSDFKSNRPLLSLCVVLRELDYYSGSQDYLLWCKELNFNPGNTQVLNYYRSLGATYREVEEILEKIDPQITDWDFEMNAGPAYELRGITQ